MTIRYHLNTLFLLVLLGAAAAADAQVQPQLAERYFKEATTLCERDAGRLWGMSLCGPMVIFDQATGTRATSQPEPEGPPPRFPGFADGPVSWGGLRWFSFPLYMLADTDADVRQQIMLHGLFHRIQPELGFMDGPTASTSISIRSKGASGCSSNGGRSAGRSSRAGATGLRRSPMRWPSDASAAACFPARQTTNGATRFAKGLPPIPASRPGPIRPRMPTVPQRQHSQEANRSRPSSEISKPRSGPGYGVLLDDLLPGWRRQVRRTSDLGDMLASATNRPPTTDVAVAAARYDGATLRTAEEARDRAQQVRVAELRRRFVDGPVLTMPAAGSGTSDTTGSVGIPEVGTVLFRNFTLSAQWGRLTADGGVLRAVDGATLSVPVTGPLEGATLQGDGWSITLNAGWLVQPAARPGSFTIVREK